MLFAGAARDAYDLSGFGRPWHAFALLLPICLAGFLTFCGDPVFRQSLHFQFVQVTLGPKGRNVVIQQSFGAPKITKDGVTVAKNIEFADNLENLGAQLVRTVANKTNDVAGDGTTTATILTRAIYTEGCKSVAAGMNPMDLRRGIQTAVDLSLIHI